MHKQCLTHREKLQACAFDVAYAVLKHFKDFKEAHNVAIDMIIEELEVIRKEVEADDYNPTNTEG